MGTVLLKICIVVEVPGTMTLTILLVLTVPRSPSWLRSLVTLIGGTTEVDVVVGALAVVPVVVTSATVDVNVDGTDGWKYVVIAFI
jgi:hypothetical protein